MLISVPITVHVSHKLNIFYVLHARVVRGEWKTTCQHACIFVSEMRVHENTRVYACTHTRKHTCALVYMHHKKILCTFAISFIAYYTRICLLTIGSGLLWR